MKDRKLIEIVVKSYFHENKDLDVMKIGELLKESLNIKISNIELEGKYLRILYGSKKNEKEIIFEINKDKIKTKRENR